MSNARAMAADQRHILQTYKRNPMAIVRAKGAYVWDADGRRYLDFLTGITVNMLGHGHPAIVGAAKAQLAKVTHVGNLFYAPQQAQLAAELLKGSFASKVAFANTGAEAIELCIKLARLHGAPKGRHEIITFSGSFHGRTYGALSATAQKSMHENLGPMLPGFRYAKFNDLASAAKLVNRKTAAIMVEPVQGEGGVRPGTREFLTGLRRLCDRKGLLLIVDEIQTGLGRTGKMYAYQHFGRAFTPDVMSLAKALGGGLPLSAVLLGRKAAKLMGPGQHGTTMGGNVVACAAGHAMLKTLQKEKLIPRAARLGALALKRLKSLAWRYPHWVAEARGLGLMLGLELKVPASELVALAMKRGVIANATAGKVLRLHPPLNIPERELARGLDVIEASLADLAKNHVNGGK